MSLASLLLWLVCVFLLFFYTSKVWRLIYRRSLTRCSRVEFLLPEMCDACSTTGFQLLALHLVAVAVAPLVWFCFPPLTFFFLWWSRCTITALERSDVCVIKVATGLQPVLSQSFVSVVCLWQASVLVRAPMFGHRFNLETPNQPVQRTSYPYSTCLTFTHGTFILPSATLALSGGYRRCCKKRLTLVYTTSGEECLCSIPCCTIYK